MKKLLSICFLSILLGLMSFSMRAQSSGFWIENLNPVTVDGVVNAPDGSGTLVLNNTLNVARVDGVDLYELHFCTDVPDSLKISVDWLLYRNGELVNGNLDDYAEIDMYTWYPELNYQGQGMAIHWIGGRLPNAFGYCNQPVQPDMFSGYDCGHAPTNYPGALQADYAAPQSVFNALGELVPSQGLYSIYTEAFDYFYAKFFQYGRTVVQIKWKQVGNYSLVMRIRERLGGTDWYNAYYNNDEHLLAGGHMSCCGQVLASDSIHYLVNGEFSKEVCQDAVPFTYGNPPYDFDRTMEDTNVVFGHIDSLHCDIFVVDSIIDFHFFVRNNPVIRVATHIDTLCTCDPYIPEDLFGVTLDPVDLDVASDTSVQWFHWGANGYDWYENADYYGPMTRRTANDTTYAFIVRQVNSYNNFNDEIVCEGKADTMYLTIRIIAAPELSPNFDVCLEAIDSTSVHHATSTHDARCATTTRWYTKVNTAYSQLSSYIDTTSLVYVGDDFPINLMQYAPTTNVDKKVNFYAVSYNAVTGCMSKFFTKYEIQYHQTPVLAKVTSPAAVNCPGDTVTMKVKINNTPDNTDTLYTYRWDGVTSILLDGNVVPGMGTQTIPVGTGTNLTSYVPFYGYNEYNYSQQIYTAQEIGTAGVITTIGFDVYNNVNFVQKNRNIKIYLLNIDANITTFSKSGSNYLYFDKQDATLVYDGTTNGVSFTQGWNDITLTTPYHYDGTSNLVVIMDDQSNQYASTYPRFYTTSTQNNITAVHSTSGGRITDFTSSRNGLSYRSNIRFNIETEVAPTQAKNQEAYFNIPETAKCNDQYSSSVYVIDSNGCVSQPVEFTYGVGVLTAPTVENVPTAPAKIYVCELNADSIPAYTTIEDVTAAGIRVIDECGKGMTVTHTDAMFRGACHDTLERVYTIHNLCDSTVSFTLTYISYDTVKPVFVRDTMDLPLVQLKPLPGGNCTYNSPDSMDFVNAVAAMVYDNCTDSAFLMSTLEFFWENTTKSPINDTNIFRVNNHLTVTAVIHDICGNFSDSTLVIYLDLPDTMWISGDPTVLPTVCEGVTPANLVFDTTLIHSDAFVGPYLPYSYEWSEVNGREVTFTNKYAKETGINPVGSGDFVFQLKVTDNNGCEALSAFYFLHVNPIPNIHVTEIPYGGATRPYCPTYGWMTVGVFDANTGNKYPASANMSYTWEGEGVNIHSIFDTTIVNIVPDSCDHDYMAIVTVADPIGCSATDTVIFPVRDTEGPIILDGVLHDTVLVANNQCKFTVPNYRPFLNTSNVTSKCGYSPTQILATYTQTPAAGTITNLDTTVIKITLTTPCGKDSVYTVYAFRPDDYVTVDVTVDGDSVCENDPTYIQNGITLTATAQNGTAPYTYAWTKGASTTVIGTDATLTVHDTNGVYTYHVAVKDAHNCPVGDQADITVWYKGAPVVYQVTPNRICDGHNGTLTILEAPTGYTYNFQGQTKISDNASHEPTLYNTVYFADLYSGTYTLTVTTIDPENCETTTDITIPNVTAEVDTVVATALAVSNCLDNNGAITITRQAGYTYYFSTDGGNTYAVTELTVIPNLSSGTYWFYRVNDATNCESPRNSVYVPYNAPSFDFTINTVNNNSYCYGDQADGSFMLATTGVDYVVTLGNDTIYEGANGTVNNLYAGTYTIVGVKTSNGCIKTKTQQITDGARKYPSANVTTTPNRYCDPTQANGTITVTKTSSSPAFTYTVLNGTDTVQPADYQSLYAATYTVNMITEKGCTGTTSKAVGNNQVTPNVTATATTNSTCIPEDFDGKITLTVTNSSAAGPGFTYMIWKDNDTTTQTNGTFNGLASGHYNYAVISQYGCERTGSKDVNQYQVPALQLVATPNYMCEPTATKPGDGTITINAPRNSTAKHYHYKYYDAAGNEYDVPFDEPFVYTLYWLADGKYRVTALELETNCMAEDSILVPLDRFNVTVNATATGNKYCTKNFDGTITVTANSSNPDAMLQYKVVGVNNDYASEYTFNTVFTGLQDGIYQVLVRDTNTACVYTSNNVEVEKIANDITITPTITADHACEGGTHDGTLSVVASTTTFDNTYFMFKFQQDADYSTTSSWTGLNSTTNYHVSVIDTISGCTVDSIFIIPLENVCAPIITINGNSRFCLNEENAQICATATNNTDVCPEGNYQFMWVIRCHHDTVYNACVDVNTSSVHNCFYDLYVKDLNTGCVSNASVEVEILPINTVNFTINHAPFYADPRTYEHCVADTVWVGVQKDKWVSVLWSNGYVTPDSKKPLDLEFCVPANTNNPNHMYTYCVDAIDSNGCPARSEINLFGNPVPRTTVHDTACFEFRFENEVITYSDDVTYPITREKIYPRVDNKHCDSIVTHEIVIKPHVTADFTKATAFLSDVYCTPTNILSQMRDSVKYSHGTLEVQIKRNNEWETFTNLNQLGLNYADSTFRFYVYNDCESKSQEFQISMNKAPQVDTFKLDTYYCASSQATFKATVSEFSKIHTGATTTNITVKMYFANDEAHAFTCTNPSTTVNGTLQPFYFTYTPTMSDNGRKIVTKVSNNCGIATDTVVLVVDTTFINITNDTICQDDALDFASILGTQASHYTNLVAHIIPVGSLVPQTYQPGSTLGMNYNGARFYFTGHGKCGNITSNTATLTVNPKPVLEVDDHYADLCVNEAANYISNQVDVQYADTTCWLYLKQAGHLVPVKNVAALVDSIKSMPQADVYYYAANGCQELTKKVGTFRILDTVKLTASSISVCPNDDLSDITLALNASIIDYGNYRTNEIKPVAVGNDGNLYDLNSHVALNTVLYNGQIRIVATATNAQQPIDFCAIDTAKATITVLTNGFKQDTLQKACDATAFVNFIKDAPVWTGSVNVQNDIEHQFWTVTYTQNQVTTSKVITTDSIMYASKHPSVQYTWITDCGDTLRTTAKTLVFYTNPELTLTRDTVHICLNDTLFINNLGFGLYDPDEITKGHDTVWTLLGETVTDYVVATEAMNGAALYATIESTCETAFDSVIVMVDTLPVVTVSGPARACANTDVTFTATPGYDTYVFIINDEEQPEQTGADANIFNVFVTSDYVDFVYANVIVTDGNGCKNRAASDTAVRVTAMPQFIFFDSTGMANATPNINGGVYDPADETHHFTATTGNGMKYVWMVNNECYNPDTLVYVEYDIYFEGRKISNDSIDDWYLIPSTYNNHGQSPLWVTSNQIFWEANDHTAKNNISYYNYAVGDPSIYVNFNEYGGNHYPNTNMGFSNSNVYDDLWMHFLAGRPVTQEISGFRRNGEYKIVFRLYATSNPNKFYHPYTHTFPDSTTAMMYIGGSNANANDAIITLLAMDSIIIDVTGEDIIDPSVLNPNDAPNFAPALVVDETVVPDMEVWPNPAPATVTTLKARVHNMSGNAIVTLSNLNGKQVYNGNIYIDNDNYYFEFGVNSLSVGTYIMTVRTGDAVVTKKVIVTVSR